jgi:hypothetical protein
VTCTRAEAAGRSCCSPRATPTAASS